MILQQGQLFIHLTTNWFYGDSFKPCLAVPSIDHQKQVIMLENNPKVTKIAVNAKSIIFSSMNTIDKARDVLVQEIQSAYQLEDRRFLERIFETPWVKREKIESFTSTTDMLLYTLSHPSSLNVLDWVLLQKEIKWEHRDPENNTLLHLALKNFDDVEKIVYVMDSVYNAKPELINQLNTAQVTPLELSIQLNKLNSRLLDCFQTNKAKIFHIQQDGTYTILLDRFEVGILDTELVVSSESFNDSKWRICSPIFGPYHCVMCRAEEFQCLTSAEFTVDCQAKMYSFPCIQLISFLTSNRILMDLHIAARYSCAINLPHLFNQQTYLKLIDKNGNNLLHSSLLAADLNNFTHLLVLHRDIETKIDLLMMPNSESLTPIHILIDKHEYGLISSFLAYRTINGNNLCHIAMAANDIRLLRVILEETGCLDLCNELNGQGESPLILGINRESTSAVEHLLEKVRGCKLEQEDDQGRNCLHISIMNYNEDIFALLLSAVVEYDPSHDVINSKLDGLTPFLLSLKEHRPDAAIKLVQSSAFIGRGQDLFPHIMDYYNNSLSLKELITLPLNQGNVGNDFNPSKVASILDLRDEQQNSLLHYSLKSGIVTGFQNILKESPLSIILTLDNENNHILLTALKLELIDQCNNIVDAVVDQADSANCDAFVNQKNIYGECPISLSVIRGYTYVITGLIRLKTRLDVVDGKNNNIFHILLEQPSSPAVFGTFKFLMEETHLRHLLTQTNDLKENPLHLVVKNSHVNIIPLLIKEDMIAGFKEPDGSTLLHCAVICDSSANQESVIQEILKHKDILNTPDFSGQTPLFYAIIRMKLAIVKLLLEKRPNLSATDNSGQDVLHYAIAGLDCLIFQTVMLAFNQSKLIDYGNYLLFCIKRGNLIYLKEMLVLNPSINQKDDQGSTLLHHMASRRDRAKMLQSLVTHIDGSSNEEYYAQCDNEGKTPLHIAIENGNFDAFKLMFHSTCHLYVRDKQGDTLLHSAARSSDLEIVNDLLRLLCATLKRKEFDSFLHIQNTRSLSALHLAIKLRRDYCVQCLIDARATLSSASRTGGVSLSGGSEDLTLNIYSTTSTYNISSVSQELGNLPSTMYAGYSIDSDDSLFIVAKLPELNVTQVKESHEIFPVTSMAEKSLKLLLKSPSAEPLRFAVKNKLLDPTKDLFKSGSISDIISEEISLQVSEYLVEIDTSDRSQHFKACSNLANTVTDSIDCLHSQLKLLSECEELNLRNDEQVFKKYLIWKAVLSSLEKLTPEALKLFLSYDLLRFDYHYCFYKKSLLHYAIERGKPANFILCILKYIQELEGSCPEKTKLNGDRFIDVSNSQGKTALHLCIEEKQIDVLETLLDFSPDITKPDSNRNTPLHLAVSSLSAEMVKHVITHVLKQPTPRRILHLQNSDRLTPLQLAVDLGNLPVLTCLLSNECSTYLLDLCFRNRKADLLNLLLKAGAGLDIRDSFGNSVLHLAVIHEDISTMQDLIATVKRKYDLCSFLKKTNDMGITPLHAAIKCDNLQAVKILVSVGAQLVNNEKFGEHTNTRFEFMKKLKFVSMKTDPESLYLGFKLSPFYCIVTCLPEMKKTELIKGSSQNLNILTEMNVISICCCESSIPLDLAIDEKLIREGTSLLDGSPISNLISKVGSVAVVEIFLARFSGFTTYLRRGWNMSMIESAVYNPELEVLKLLLDKLPPSVPKSERIKISYCLSSSLKLSVENELIGAFDLLLDKQADVYSTFGINSDTLLHLMVINDTSSAFISSAMKRISLVEDKHSAGLRFINYQNSNGRTALHSSTDLKKEQMVECLLTWSPDLSIRDSQGNTVLHLAVQSNNIKLVRMLITALKNAPDTTQSPLDSPNKIGCRPLHLAVLGGNVSITELLLETECAYSSTQDRFGDTFLHYAVCSKKSQLMLVKLLIKFNQTLHSKKRMLNTRDRRGNTPLLLAETLEREEIAECIRTSSGTADEPNSQALHSGPNRISYQLVRILAEQTDVGYIPREISQELGIHSHFLSTPNSQASITGCYWCGDSSNEMDGLTCSTACFFRLHTWCLEKAEQFCGVLLCSLPGCSSEVMGGTHGCCCGAHLKVLLALRGKDLKCGDKTCPHWYEEMPP